MYGLLFSLAASLPLAQAASGLVPRQTTTTCAKGVHVLAAGGGNSPDPSSYGLLGSLASSIVSSIPGSDMVSVPYDKLDVPNTNVSAPPMLQPTAIPGGISTLNSYVSQYHASCPDTKMVLIGYSSGAVITMSSLCQGGVDMSLADSTIIATVVYGDQTRVPGQSYDFGTCTQGGLAASRRDPAGCGAFAGGMASYCDTNDPQCCSGPASDYEIHLGYANEYDSAATAFVMKRWQLLGSASSSSSSSSSSSTSSAIISTSTSATSPYGNTTSSPGFPAFPTTGSGTGASTSASLPTTTVATVTTSMSTTTSPTTTPSSTITPAGNGAWSMGPSSILLVTMFLGTLKLFY